MRPVGLTSQKSKNDLDTSTDVSGVANEATATSSTPTAVSSRRPHSRGFSHPAYAPLEVPGAADTPDAPEEGGLQVQVRVRDGGRSSPLIATPTHGRMGGAWHPYHSGPNSPSLPSPVYQPAYDFPPAAPVMHNSGMGSEKAPLEALPPTVVHHALHGKCRFIAFPSLAPFEPPPPPTGSFPLFIGQVRFETTPAELVWLFHRTCGASVTTIETRGTGCFIVHLKSESERALVRQLHKRVLFDIGAVWFARSTEEVDSLCEYVTLDGPYRSKQAKLPRDSMVVEDIKVDSADATPCYPFYYPNNGVQGYQGFHSGDRRGGGVSSNRSTPTRAHPYGSKPSSPSLAPMPPAYPQMGRMPDGTGMNTPERHSFHRRGGG